MRAAPRLIERAVEPAHIPMPTGHTSSVSKRTHRPWLRGEDPAEGGQADGGQTGHGAVAGGQLGSGVLGHQEIALQRQHPAEAGGPVGRMGIPGAE